MIDSAGLRSVPDCVAACLCPDTAARANARAELPGVIVLALDGLAFHVAAQSLAHAELAAMRSTFPSTSATAWLTSVTGLDASEHGVVGTVYRVPGTERLANVITGQLTEPFATAPPAAAAHVTAEHVIAGHATEGKEPPVLTSATIFDRARMLGAEPLAVGAELAAARGPWINALLHGATLRVDNASSARTVSEIVEQIVREVEAVIAPPSAEPVLLWAYVNLDGHIHRSGYDAPLLAALRSLDEAACRWADRGWTVLAHADHGQTPVSPDAQLTARWDTLDDPRYCRLPGGGAGRVRWLYPRPGQEDRLARELAAAFDEHAFIFTPDELEDRGLMKASPIVRARIGELVAIAASSRFPVPDPVSVYEHGSITEDEMLVPFAAWGAPVTALAAPVSAAAAASAYTSALPPS